ncbi:MAG TPA: hypothetical protein VF744_07890 [Beijerinckiaceae bacterium]|jgi:hypothetical protein
MDDADDTYSEAETIARREAALKRMLSTPHIPNPKREPTPTGTKRGRPAKAGEARKSAKGKGMRTT